MSEKIAGKFLGIFVAFRLGPRQNGVIMLTLSALKIRYQYMGFQKPLAE